MYIIYIQNVWICRKIKYLELRKFNGKFCALCMYGMSGFAEKLNIQNCENSMGNYLQYICTEGLDLLKNWISRTAKLCTLYLYVMSGFPKNLNVQNSVNWTGNCIYNLYGMSGFAKKLNIQNCENSTGNCVHFIRMECLDLLRNWISWTAKIELEIVYILCTECLD